MINNVSFAGRETMLTKGVKSSAEKLVDKAHEYVGAGKIYGQNEIDVVENLVNRAQTKDSVVRVAEESAEARYTSPFAPTHVDQGDLSKVTEEKNGYLYNVAHGKPQEVAEEGASMKSVLAAKLDVLA